MRLRLRISASRATIALGLLALPLLAQRYDSMSARELQRRLENDTNQQVNSLRNQHNLYSSTPTVLPGYLPTPLRQRA